MCSYDSYGVENPCVSQQYYGADRPELQMVITAKEPSDRRLASLTGNKTRLLGLLGIPSLREDVQKREVNNCTV